MAKQLTQTEFDRLGYTCADALERISKNTDTRIVKEKAFCWPDPASGESLSVEVVVKRI